MVACFDGNRLDQQIKLGKDKGCFWSAKEFSDLLVVDPSDAIGDSWKLLVVQSWSGEERKDNPFFVVTIDKNKPLSESISAAAFKDRSGEWFYGIGRSRTELNPLLRMAKLVIGSALFSVGANHKFLHRIPERRGAAKRRARAKKKRRPVGYEDKDRRVWSMGPSIKLPNRGGGGGSSSKSDSGRLKWAHMRQGHLRLQRVGPRGKGKYSLRYIPPTVVRPDLGFPEGYKATRHDMDRPARSA